LSSDSVEYLTLARNLQQSGVFSLHPAGWPPELYRTPGYPAFLLLLRAWSGLGALRLALLAQVLLLLASGLLLTGTPQPRGQGGNDRTWLPALLFLVHPMVLCSSFQVLTETLFVFLCVVSAWLLRRGFRGASAPHLGASGLALGAAALVRPIGLVLMPGFAFFALFAAGGTERRPRERAARRFWRRALPFLAGSLLLPGAWALHNGVRHGYWGISKTGPSYLSSLYRAEAVGDADAAANSSRAALTEILRSIGRRPLGTLADMAVGLGRSLFGPGEWTLRRALLGEEGGRSPADPAPLVHAIEERDGLRLERVPPPTEGSPASGRGFLIWVLLGWSWVTAGWLYLLALRGLLRGIRRRDRFCLLWCYAAAALLLAAAGYQANARFRVPALPFLALLASVPAAAQAASRADERGEYAPSR